MKRLLLLVLLWPVILSPAAAQQPAVIVDALDGLDPVALIAGREAVGRQAYAMVHDGLRYLFESADHLAAFKKSPDSYVLQNRGMCARMGAPIPGNQSLYLVHEGRIYVFASEGCQAAFKEAPASYIAPAEVAPPSDAASASRAMALLDRAADGFGGAALVDAVSTLRTVTTGTRTMQNGTTVTEKTTTTVAWPGRWRQDLAMGTRSGRMVVTSDDAFGLVNSNITALSQAQRDGLTTEVLRHPLWLVKQRRDPGVRAWMEGPNEVGMFVRGQRLRLSMHPDTGRVVQVSATARGRSGQFGTVAVMFSDYKGNGLMFPHRESRRFNDTSSGPDTIYDSIEINLALPADFFRRPAEKVAQAWSQWGGPARDFTSADHGLALVWPAGGPPRLWQRQLGDGLSAIITDGQRAFAVSRDHDNDVVVAIRMTDGTTVWESRYAAPFDERCSHKLGPAPRATPLLTGTVLVTASAGGLINAFDHQTGARLWTRDLTAGGASVLPCGYTSSPLAHDDMVITAGADRGLVALETRTGRTVWQVSEFESSYTSPILANVDGRPEIISLTATHIIGVDPRTGAVEWQHAHPAEYGANVSTPVWSPEDGLLFVSSAYSGGSRALRLKRQGERVLVEQLWHHQRVRVHFGNIVRLGSTVYASSGDTGSAPLGAVDLPSGEILWRSRAVGRAMLVAAGPRLILLDEDGHLVLATPTESGLTIHAQTDALTELAWTPPTLSGTTLLIRNRREVVAFNLSAEDSPSLP